MTRLVLRNTNGKIVSSYNLPQQGLRLSEIDDDSEEYKSWIQEINSTIPQKALEK